MRGESGNIPETVPAEKTLRHRRLPSWLPLAVLIIGGALLRLEYLREFSQHPHFFYTIGADIAEYAGRAREILAGKLMPETLSIHAPFYPLFMATVWQFTGESAVLLRVLQLALNFAAWLVIYAVAGKYRFPRKLRLAFLAVAMFSPALIFHQAELISESLLIPLLALAFWSFYLYDKGKNTLFLLLSGAITGVTVLTHGLMLSFAAGLCAALFFQRKTTVAMKFSLAAAAVLIAAVTINSICYRQLSGIQGNSAFNIFLGNNPDSTGGCYLRPYKEWRDFHKAIEKEAKAANISENRLYWQKVADFYFNRPQAAARLLLKKSAMVAAPWEAVAGADPGAFVLLTPLQNAARFIPFMILVLALTGLAETVRNRKLLQKYLVFLLPSAALAAALVLTVVSGRYRIGMMPGIFLLAAIGICRMNWKLMTLLTALAAAAAIIWHPGKTMPWEAASITAEVLMKQQKYDDAEPLIRFAMQHIDDPSRFNNMLGNIAELRGDLQSAEKQYRTALAAEPDQYISSFNLGQLLFRDRRRRAEGCSMLRNSLKLNPAQGAAWNFLGVDFFERRQLAEAAECFANAHRLAPDNPGYKRNFEVLRGLLEAKNK